MFCPSLLQRDSYTHVRFSSERKGRVNFVIKIFIIMPTPAYKAHQSIVLYLLTRVRVHFLQLSTTGTNWDTLSAGYIELGRCGTSPVQQDSYSLAHSVQLLLLKAHLKNRNRTQISKPFLLHRYRRLVGN